MSCQISGFAEPAEQSPGPPAIVRASFVGRIPVSLAARIRAISRDRRGAAAAEFALLLPVLTLLLCSVFQYGLLLYSYNVMLNTARNGARSLAIGSSTEAGVVTIAKSNLPVWVAADKWTITPQSTATTGTNQVTTRITIESRYATLLPLGPMPATLDVFVVMLKEV